MEVDIRQGGSMKNKHEVWAMFAVVGALALGACGSDSARGSQSGTPPQTETGDDTSIDSNASPPSSDSDASTATPPSSGPEAATASTVGCDATAGEFVCKLQQAWGYRADGTARERRWTELLTSVPDLTTLLAWYGDLADTYGKG
jgi:hypothetical protein